MKCGQSKTELVLECEELGEKNVRKKRVRGFPLQPPLCLIATGLSPVPQTGLLGGVLC